MTESKLYTLCKGKDPRLGMVKKLSGGEYNLLIFFLNIYYYFSIGEIGAQSLKDTQPPSVGLWDFESPDNTHFPKANVLGTDSSHHIQSFSLLSMSPVYQWPMFVYVSFEEKRTLKFLTIQKIHDLEGIPNLTSYVPEVYQETVQSHSVK